MAEAIQLYQMLNYQQKVLPEIIYKGKAGNIENNMQITAQVTTILHKVLIK